MTAHSTKPQSIATKPLTGLILAGGLSSRMGSDKAGLSVNGVSLLEKNKSLLTQLSPEQLLISGAKAGQIPDKVEQAGPVGGIFSTLEFVHPNSALLVVPVDMPNLNAQLLEQLIANGMQQQTACYFKDYFFPAFFYNIDDLQQAADQLLNQPGKACSVKALLNAVKAKSISIEPAGIEKNLINVNTPQQWQAYIKQQT